MAAPNPVVNLKAVAVAAAHRAGIDPNVFLRQINQESGFNPNARSGAGAVGIAQIVPKYHPGVNPLDPVASLNYAANWMGKLVREYGGSYAKALSVYNSGRPDAYQNPGFAGGQTYNYVKTILGGTPLATAVPRSAPAPVTQPSPVALAGPQQPVQRPTVNSNTLALLNAGNQMFGLPALPSTVLSSAPSRLPTAGPSVTPSPTAAPPTKPYAAPVVKGKTLRYIEHFAAPFGLQITATTNGSHAKNSYHYQGRAVDFGAPLNQAGYQKMSALAKTALSHPDQWSELIYTGPGNPGYSILGGKVIPNSQLPKSLYDEHTNHVHLAR